MLKQKFENSQKESEEEIERRREAKRLSMRRSKERLKNNNPEKYEELKKRNRECKRKSRKKISEMNDLEKKHIRKKWCELAKAHRERKNEVIQVIGLSQGGNKGKPFETTKQRKRRLEKEKQKRREKLANETAEEKRLRLDKRNLKLRMAYQSKRKPRLSVNHQRYAPQDELLLQDLRHKQVPTIANETQEQHKTRLQDLHQRQAQPNPGHFLQDMTSIYPMPVIKTEILEPPELHQEFILPDSKQHATTLDPTLVIKTEIQDPPITNEFILPKVKVELIEVDYALDMSSRTEDPSEGFIKSETENSLTLKYKPTKCSVLLHDCLIPENLASISAKFKFLKINTDIPKTFPNLNLFPLSDTPFLPHISEAYKEMAFPKGKKTPSSRRKKKPKPSIEVYLNNKIKKKYYNDRRKKHICSCFKASEDAMISMGSEYYENFSASTQQLCSCLTSDYKLTESTDILMKEVALLDPDFGKISGSINKIHFNF